MTGDEPGAVVPDPEALQGLAARAAILGAIKAKVEAEHRAARQALEEGLREAKRVQGIHSLDVTVPDELAAEDQRVAATVSFNKDGKPTVTVTHMESAVEWVARNHPEFIREVIDPTYLANLLKSLVIAEDGKTVVHPKTGEVLDWAVPVRGAKGAMVVKFPDEGQDHVLAAWLAGHFGQVQVGALPAPPATSPGQGG